MKDIIYLDYNSTTAPFLEVVSIMNDVYKLPLNSASNHQLGKYGNKILDDARKSIQNLLNAQNYEVIFTSSSTEATNMVMFGLDVEEILFSTIEHASVYNCRPQNKKITEIKSDSNGLIDITDLEKNIPNHRNFILSLMLANNETGAIQPVEEVAKIIHQKQALIHCDIVQAVGKIEVDLEKLNVDFASISAHKINGPQGVGALLVRKGIDIKPLILGSKQEKAKRAGTVNVAGVAGFGVACEISKKKILDYKNVKSLRDYLENEIKKIGKENVKIFSTEVERLPNTSYIAIKDVSNQTQLIHFDLNKIMVSAGTACSSGTTQESRVLKSMSVDKSFLSSAIRVSLSTETSKNEIDQFIDTWKKIYLKTYA